MTNIIHRLDGESALGLGSEACCTTYKPNKKTSPVLKSLKSTYTGRGDHGWTEMGELKEKEAKRSIALKAPLSSITSKWADPK